MIQNFIASFIQPKLLVLHVKPMFVLSKRILSSENWEAAKSELILKTKNRLLPTSFRLILH